jgi:lysyl-tRNA synthetase class 2
MPSRLDDINQQRRETLARLRERGVAPYPNNYDRTSTTAEAVALLEAEEKAAAAENRPAERVPGRGGPPLRVAGRITAMRKMGKSSFLDIRDGTGRLQLLMRNVDFNEARAELFKDLDIGDTIGAEGTVMRTRTGEPTVAVADFTLLSKSLRPLPEKWHGLSDTETRYRQRYVDLIANTEVRDLFVTRSRIVAAVRRFMNERGFLEVETPVLNPSAGGALAAPFVTHHNALDRDFYLRIATELHLKRLVAGGFDRVYEIGHVFRNEGVSATHSPEYTLLESYEAYADYRDVMAMTEEMVASVAREVLGTTKITYGEHEIDLGPPWERITLRDAVKKYTGIDYATYPTADGLRERMRGKGLDAPTDLNWAKLVDEMLKDHVRPECVQPTIVYDYPVSMSPLAKTKPGEERVVERFQVIVGGSLEIANAYSELNDPVQQRERFVEQARGRHGDDPEQWTIDEDYLTALEYGMPPTGGLGVGIDRLVMLLTDQTSIREVILFPQLKEKG